MFSMRSIAHEPSGGDLEIDIVNKSVSKPHQDLGFLCDVTFYGASAAAITVAFKL